MSPIKVRKHSDQRAGRFIGSVSKVNMFGTRLFNLSLDNLFCFERYSSKSIDDLDKT